MAKAIAKKNADIRYRYIAKDIDGNTKRGTSVAAGADELYDKLLDQGLYLQSATRQISGGRKHMIKAQALSEFCRQLSSLLGAGISLVKALSIITQEEGLRPELRRIYEEVLADVRRGINLSVAMENQGVFPELMLGMVRAGEGTGELPAVTDRLADHFTKEHQLNQQVKSAMTYPAVLAVMSVLVVIVIVTFVLPQFEELFAGMAQLPVLTQVLMAFSDFMVTKWYILLIAVVLIAVLMRVLLSAPKVRLAVDKMKLKLPVFGRFNRVACTARFARSLSSLYSSGVPIISALQTGRDTVGNAYIASQFEEVLGRVRSGDELSAALSGVDGFQRKLAGTIQVGEETGRLDAMLNSVADAMEYDTQQASKRMMTLLEPVLIMIMALVVGLIIVAVMLPLMESYGTIENYGNY